jgi:hypothetical protein
MRQHKWILPVMAAICLAAVAVMIVALFVGESHTKQAEFTPPPFDAAAQTGVPTVPDGLGWGEIDAKAYKFSVCGAMQLAGGQSDVYFTNPEENTVWLKLRVLDENGNVLGETGLIRPGEYVQSVTISSSPADGATIRLKIMAYEPDTYNSAGSVTLKTTIKSDYKG